MNVLLIEDSKGDIFLIDSAFEELGIKYNLSVMENGKEALEYIVKAESGQASLPAFIILDLNLPIINGFEVLERIKHSIKLKDTPVIIFSSSTEEKDKARALELGAMAYFSKPVDYDTYMTIVESFLGILDL
ncbi:MAG TPA: response regulator [Ignavibacteriales bacterium]|nr:response regulator [Ignavibacteriales bacterium]